MTDMELREITNNIANFIRKKHKVWRVGVWFDKDGTPRITCQDCWEGDNANLNGTLDLNYKDLRFFTRKKDAVLFHKYLQNILVWKDPEEEEALREALISAYRG